MEADAGKLEFIKLNLIRSWSRETASPACQGQWSEQNPSLGQCAVTALLIQAMMGGYIMRTVVENFGSHYYNILPDGRECDLTRGQFPPGTVVPPGQIADRDAMLYSERGKAARTLERYALLLNRFMDRSFLEKE